MANVANEAYTNIDSPQSLKMFIIEICNQYLSLLQTCPLCDIFSKIVWLEFYSNSRTARPRKLANVANEASTDVDSALTLKMFIIAIFNQCFILFQTGPFFTIFGNFFLNNFWRFDSF
jgi:hypothetical protein